MPRGRRRKDALSDHEVMERLSQNDSDFKMHCYGNDIKQEPERHVIDRLVTQRTTSTCPSEQMDHTGNHASDGECGGQDSGDMPSKYWSSSGRKTNPAISGQPNGIISDGNSPGESPDRGVPLWETTPTLTLTAPGFGLLDPRSAFPEGRVVGVYFDKQRRIWRANWREGGVGKRKTKNFSVDDYGFEEARRLAIEYRLLKIMEVSDKQMGGGAAAMEQAAYLHAELKRKKGADSKGKRRRCYALSNNSFTKRSSYLDDEYRAAGAYGWGEGDLGSGSSVHQDDLYAVRALHWRSWDYQMAVQIAASGGSYSPYEAAGGYLHQPPMWQQQGLRTPPLCFEGRDVSDGTVANSSKVVTARPIEDDFDSAFPSSLSIENRRTGSISENAGLIVDVAMEERCTKSDRDDFEWDGHQSREDFTHHHNLTGLTHDET